MVEQDGTPPSLRTASLYIDASSLTKDEITTVGYVLKDDNEITIETSGKLLPVYKDSTQAEYEALIYALHRVLPRYEIEDLTIYSDSWSLIQVTNPNKPGKAQADSIKQYVKYVQPLLEYTEEITLKYIPREENTEADRITTNIRTPPIKTLP